MINFRKLLYFNYIFFIKLTLKFQLIVKNINILKLK
jgi:hypothetical protein